MLRVLGVFLLVTIHANNLDCPNAVGEWEESYDPSDPGDIPNPTVCQGRCGTGEKITSFKRDCCAADSSLCEAHSLTKTETEDCDLGLPCKTSDWKLYEGYRCEGDVGTDMTFLGRVGSEGDCQALAEQGTYEAFYLECIGNTVYTNVACYGCKNMRVVASSCGSHVYSETSYDWNWGIMGVGLGLAFLITVIAFAANKMMGKDEDDGPPLTNTVDFDPLRIELDETICECCPFFDLSVATTVMCFVGFAFGALLQYVFETSDSPKAEADWLKVIYYPGEIWINILKMIVTPLIALMMFTLPDRIDLLKSKIGLHLLAFYVFTSSIAACEGLIWVNIIQPGDVDLFVTFEKDGISNSLSEIDSLLGIGRKAFPKSLFGALVSGNILGIITFFLTLGVIIQSDAIRPDWRRFAVDGAKACLKSIMLTIPFLIRFTPFAMASIVTTKVAGIDNLELLMKTEGLYLLTQTLGQCIHAFGFYPLLMFIATKCNGYGYFSEIRKAPFTAFATSSSAATLPVTMATLRTYGIHPSVADFIAPIGSAINMDGTSLGFPVMVMFTAQLVNEEINAGTQITIALLAITCSIGTAPIPNAGLVYITMLFTAAGGRLADDDVIALGLAMIVVLDWFVDRVETAQNVWSDCVACKVFHEWGYGDALVRDQKDSEVELKKRTVQADSASGENKEESTPWDTQTVAS